MKIRCLVDNSARRGARFWGEHGLSFHVETADGAVLFDTGQSGDVLLHNAGLFGLDLAQVDALAISHAHYDHTGGLEAFLAHSKPGIPLYANPDLFRERYSQRGDEYRAIGMPISRETLTTRTDLRLNAEPTEILPGVWTTGVIGERPFFEGRSAHHFIRAGDGWQPDPYADDLSLVLETAAGLVVICGCCHAGLLNTLAHIRRHFTGAIIAAMGGTHLVSASGADLRQAADMLRDIYGSPRLYPAHCTGERAYMVLAEAFGDRVQPCPAGTMLDFA